MPQDWKPKQLSMTSEVILLSRESILTVFQTIVLPYSILNLILEPTDKCSYQPSSKKPLFGEQVEIFIESHNAKINGEWGALTTGMMGSILEL